MFRCPLDASVSRQPPSLPPVRVILVKEGSMYLPLRFSPSLFFSFSSSFESKATTYRCNTIQISTYTRWTQTRNASCILFGNPGKNSPEIIRYSHSTITMEFSGYYNLLQLDKSFRFFHSSYHRRTSTLRIRHPIGLRSLLKVNFVVSFRLK